MTISGRTGILRKDIDLTGQYTCGLYKVTKNDIGRCAAALAEAFSEDDAMLHFAGGVNTKGRLNSLFKFIVKASLKYGCVYATGPEMEGVVIWLPENKTFLSTRDFFMYGGMGMILRHGFGMPRRMMKYEEFTAGRHHANITEPHWYLLALAVAREHRKKGFTSKLIRPFLDYFDKNGTPCYLETGKGNNEAMYRHYGFDLIEKIDIPGTDAVFKAMLRKPRKVHV